MNPLIQSLTEGQLRTDIPSFRPGDTVRVHAKVVEGNRERIQIFEGVVISRKGQGISEMYTVRKISGGVGVSCYNSVFNLCGFKFEKTNSGKTFDCYLISKK